MKQVRILKYQNLKATPATDAVIDESTIFINVNNKSNLQFNCLQENLHELVIGYLYSSKYISKIEDLISINYNETNSQYNVTFDNSAIMERKQTSFSCKMEVQEIYRIASEFQNLSDRFKSTGAVHTAALINQNSIIYWIDDISRHAALDKLIGYCVLNKTNLNNSAIMLTCRITKTIAEKVINSGIPIVLSIGAVSDKAIDLCQLNNTTLVGFIKNDKLSIYTHYKRIV